MKDINESLGNKKGGDHSELRTPTSFLTPHQFAITHVSVF